jgi:hypothetical protein
MNCILTGEIEHLANASWLYRICSVAELGHVPAEPAFTIN